MAHPSVKFWERWSRGEVSGLRKTSARWVDSDPVLIGSVRGFFKRCEKCRRRDD
jgi:hypothetical protein